MPSPGTLRDSTQIVLSNELLEEFREETDEQFVVSFHADTESTVRIIDSPVEIRRVSDYLTRQGITVR